MLRGWFRGWEKSRCFEGVGRGIKSAWWVVGVVWVFGSLVIDGFREK